MWNRTWQLAALTFAISESLLSGQVQAQTEIFNNAEWIVTGFPTSSENPNPIAVTSARANKGTFGELLIFHAMGPGNFPQVFSIKGIGALRAVLPSPGEFGGTFYLTGYWDCVQGFLQNTFITNLDLQVPKHRQKTLTFRGKISNKNSFAANDFELTIDEPQAQQVTAHVSYKLVATRSFCVDESRQQNHEGFRLTRIASNFISDAVQDSDYATYVNSESDAICAPLENQSALIFDNPLPLGRTFLTLGHTDATPRNTPNLTIQFTRRFADDIVPQGFVTETQDPNADNVDLWANWEDAQSEYRSGETIGKFSYDLIARPPAPSPCEN